MARYRPDIRWEFDWAGDGRFAHPQSRIAADDVTSWRVRWGTAADTPQGSFVDPASSEVVSVGGILSDGAVGQIRIFDRDGRFDPDNPALLVDEVALRAPVAVRVLYDGDEVWRGRALPTYGTSFDPVTEFTWNLTGVHNLEDRIEVLENVANVDEVADGIASFRGVDLPLDTVTFNGPRVKFYEAVATLAGGWAVELHDGRVELRTMGTAPQPSVLLDESYGVVDPAVREFRTLVRTLATLSSQAWVQVTNENAGEVDGSGRLVPLLRPVSVGTLRPENLQPNRPRIITYRLREGDDRRVDEWLTPEAEGAFFFVASTTSRSITYRVFPSRSDLVIRHPAYVSEIRETSRREVEIPTAVQVYGRRRLDLQPWLSQSQARSEDVVVPWLANLSEPLVMFRATYSEWQEARSLQRALLQLRPGNTAIMRLATQQNEQRDVHGLVLAAELTGGAGQMPQRRVWGVEVRHRPPSPLVAIAAVASSPFSADVEVRISGVNPGDGRTMHVRLEEV